MMIMLIMMIMTMMTMMMMMMMIGVMFLTGTVTRMNCSIQIFSRR